MVFRARLLLLTGLVTAVPALVMVAPALEAGPPVKVGVLQSLTGTMAISEVTVKNAELLAIAEINARGGVLGRQTRAAIPTPMDPARLAPNQSLIQRAYVGQLQPDGQFRIASQLQGMINPGPYDALAFPGKTCKPA